MHECPGCDKKLMRQTVTGYCNACYKLNVNSCRSLYEKALWSGGHRKRTHWKSRGADLLDSDIEEFDKATRCELCSKEFTGDKVLDHDHTTGLYRGALCRQCNTSLGKLGDDLCLVIRRVSDYAVKLHEKIKQRGKPEPSCLAD